MFALALHGIPLPPQGKEGHNKRRERNQHTEMYNNPIHNICHYNEIISHHEIIFAGLKKQAPVRKQGFASLLTGEKWHNC
jgi:hypothetical protein